MVWPDDGESGFRLLYFIQKLVQPCLNSGESITCYQRPLHACEARRRSHYAVASQTHRWHRYQAIDSPKFKQCCTSTSLHSLWKSNARDEFTYILIYYRQYFNNLNLFSAWIFSPVGAGHAPLAHSPLAAFAKCSCKQGTWLIPRGNNSSDNT